MKDLYDRESIVDLVKLWSDTLPEWIDTADLDKLIELLNEFISH